MFSNEHKTTEAIAYWTEYYNELGKRWHDGGIDKERVLALLMETMVKDHVKGKELLPSKDNKGLWQWMEHTLTRTGKTAEDTHVRLATWNGLVCEAQMGRNIVYDEVRQKISAKWSVDML